ncbi:MAG: KpsF/GutQ family sugar-phosphate isomerase [Flavobacteriales bacterium]|nr:KpsF/GutQ family sugar-phosphate isomerase [Flavobacteriales bacterium]
MLTDNEILESAQQTLKIEAESLKDLIPLLNSDFANATKAVFECKGRLIVSGIGKSANVAHKIVATLNSTGTPAVFMHAADAIHGDLGIVLKDDIVMILSNSGNSPEIKALLPFIKSRGNKVIAVVGNLKSDLGQKSDWVFNSSVKKEACSNNLAPTSSTTAQMALGDALAVALINMRGFTSVDFAKSHPGGALGKKFYLKIDEIVAKNERPQVKLSSTINEVIYEMSSKRLGATAVVKEDKVIGIITDGDIRRMIEKTKDLTNVKAQDIMGNNPLSLPLGALASEAMRIVKEKNIMHLVIVDEQNKYVGIIHLHDLINEGISEE